MNERPTFYSSPALYDSVDDWAKTFYELVAPQNRLFRSTSGTLLFMSHSAGAQHITKVTDFAGPLTSLVNVVAARRGPDGEPRDVPVIMKLDQLAILFQSPHSALLPKITSVITEPVIALRNGRPVVVDKVGFNPESGIYYWKSPEKPIIKVRDNIEHLTKCFSGVPWRTPENRNNVLAWLLGGVVLDPTMSAPMLTVTGNDRGVGKSSTAQAAGMILTGDLQSPVHAQGGEFVKQLSSRFLDGQRFIMLDNVVGKGGKEKTFKSEPLARFLTSGWSKQVRILGVSRSVSQSGVLFCLTANDCRLDPDLATRAIIADLYREELAPMNPYVLDYARAHRTELYGELLGLALSVPEKTHTTEHQTFRFRAWLDFVLPRIGKAFGGLAVGEAGTLDERFQDLFAWGYDNVDRVFTAHDLQKVMTDTGHDYTYAALFDYLTGFASARQKMHACARVVANHVGQVYEPQPGTKIILEVAEPATKKAPAKYKFVQVGGEECTSTS